MGGENPRTNQNRLDPRDLMPGMSMHRLKHMQEAMLTKLEGACGVQLQRQAVGGQPILMPKVEKASWGAVTEIVRPCSESLGRMTSGATGEATQKSKLLLQRQFTWITQPEEEPVHKMTELGMTGCWYAGLERETHGKPLVCRTAGDKLKTKLSKHM